MDLAADTTVSTSRLTRWVRSRPRAAFAAVLGVHLASSYLGTCGGLGRTNVALDAACAA